MPLRSGNTFHSAVTSISSQPHDARRVREAWSVPLPAAS